MKLKRSIAFLLILCCILSGCGNNSSDNQEIASNEIVNSSSVVEQSALIGQWEGTGYFDSLASRGEECKYILDFFEDGSMSISSSNMYFYGYKVEDVSIHDGMVEFSLPINDPTGYLDFIPVDSREAMKISMSLKISENSLVGTAKQGDWSIGMTFNKTSSQPRTYEETDLMSVEQMAEDANILFEILETKHPNIYYTQSQEEYGKKKSELMAKLPTLDKQGFHFELCRLLASIWDAHTAVFRTESMQEKTRLLPIGINYFSGKWHIISTDKQYEQLLGKEITAVNDIPIDEVFARVTEMEAHENLAKARKNFRYSFNNADLLEYIDIINDGQATITVNGTEHVVVSAISQFGYKKENERVLARPSETSYNSSSDYAFKALGSDILYLQYNSCSDSEDYPVSKFGEELATELTAKKYNKIVIDLRNNGGGNVNLIYDFIEPIFKARDNGAQLYCLIGGKTFSAAFMNTIMLNEEGAMLVGQPTGGNMQHFSQVSFFNLPNSCFKGQYSTLFMNFDENAPYDSLYPDKQIDHTIDACKNGIDEEIEYIKKQ